MSLNISPTALLHLQWIKKHPTFVCDWCILTPNETYFDVMTLMYTQWDWNHRYSEKCVDRYFSDDLRVFEAYENSVAVKKTEYKIGVNVRKWFCTLGFNHQTYNLSKCLAILQTIMGFSWVIKCKAVFELHTEAGEHPHIHMILSAEESKSKVIEKLWATAGIKSVMLKKSFVSVEPYLVAHDAYLQLDKQDKKLKYVAKDIAWRKLNNIPEFFEK